MTLGITIKEKIGIGDKLQFSSVPENYFRATGKKIYDISQPWFFDYNPYVTRERPEHVSKVQEMWNFSPTQYQWPKIKDGRQVEMYQCNAEIWAAVVGVPVKLVRPRLYMFEDFPFEKREKIIFHAFGKSHGALPDHVIEHVLKKYGPTGNLVQLMGPKCLDLGIAKIRTNDMWHLAEQISDARMYIGVDSGPSWIAACFPDIQLKKIRTRPSKDVLKTWIPLEVGNIHSHWDDRVFQLYNTTQEDVGFTQSYVKI